MTTIDNSRYLTILNSDKNESTSYYTGLAGENNQNDFIERKQILFKGIEKILQNEENRLIQNDTIKNSN